MEKEDFYIVGVGGSAGALSAFRDFLKNVPTDTAAAYVVVQHLLPATESNLAKILSGITHLPVTEVQSGVSLERGHVYIIPPDKSITVQKNNLRLTPRKRGVPNDAIDTFLISLAKFKKDNAIGVLLSGTGSDGTQGLKAIKAAGGMTFAQDKTAQFGAMPENAQRAGVVNYVLEPAQIALKIAEIMRRSSDFDKVHSSTEVISAPKEADEEKDLQAILAIVQSSSDVDFTYYKPGTIRRRIMRRMLLNNVPTYREYVDYLRNNPEESQSLYRDILIHVTDFFRDREIFDFLEKEIFPKFIRNKSAIRIWIPGCSTGEEAYSYAIVLAELMEASDIKIPIHIFGTDLSEESLQIARQGVYPMTIAESVPPKILRKYFTEIQGQYQINKEIRAMCVFAKHNMIADIPFSKLDVISCRNVLIYLDSYLQKKAFPIFHYGLNPDGLLILGTAETAGNFQDLFKQIDSRHRIYTKKFTPHRPTFEFPAVRVHGKLSPIPALMPNMTNAHVNIEKEADLLFRKKKAEAGIIVNDDLTIMQFRGDVTPYLSPAPGRATLDLLKMAHKSFLPKILELMVKVKKESKAVKNAYLAIKTEIEIIPLNNPPSEEKYYLILFRALGAKKEVAKKVAKAKAKGALRGEMTDAIALQRELSSTIEQLQAVIEARDASNEELRSAHEEVMSANEELQSTNEELETTKEELQSTNEELLTLNSELENRNADLIYHAKELYRKDEFLSFLGHELRNPLSPIVHALELIQLHGIQDNELREMFDIIQRQTKVLNDIIKNLLDAARAISGKIDLQKELIDFNSVLDRALETVQPIIKANKHTLEVNRLDNPVSMLMDPGRVEQIIVNIVTNAAKYTKQGGHICVTATHEGSRLFLSVKDNGMGIAPEVLPRIFSLFYQGDQSLSNFKGGLGVGLVLSSTLAKLHGGNLTAKSEGTGKGSEFILELPIQRGSGSDRQIKDIDIKDLKLQKRHIMIIDDNIELADVFAELLRKLGQDVSVVYTSTQALEKARAEVPEIIFIDVAMPSMSGYELVDLLRREPVLRKTRFIALSGFGKEYNQKSLEAGFDEHVIKPVTPSELQRILSQM